MAKPNGKDRDLYLPLDLSASSSDNWITSEEIYADSFQKTFIFLKYGAYFAHTLELYVKTLTGLERLKHGVDYQFAAYDANSSELSGYEVYRLIKIINPNTSGAFSADYQALGGDNNVDVGYLNTLVKEATNAQASVDFADINEKPATQIPRAHKHDFKDVIGFSILAAEVASLQKVISARNSAFRASTHRKSDIRIAQKLQTIAASVSAFVAPLQTAIAAHISGSAHKHPYTKASVGLDKVGNYNFGPQVLDGNGAPIPYYASPLKIKQLIDTRGPVDTFPHISDTSNPDGVTKTHIGLGKVENLVLRNLVDATYTSSYYFDTVRAQPQYIGNYALATASVQYLTDKVMQSINLQTSALTNGSSPFTSLSAKNGMQVTMNNTLSTKKNDLTASFSALDTAATQLDTANTRFAIKYLNFAESLALQKVLDYDFAIKSAQDTPGDTWPIPSKIGGLYLWVDANNPDNTIKTDAQGITRVSALKDKSLNARLFVNNNLAKCPKFAISRDRSDGTGPLNRNTLIFEQGSYLELISGPALNIQTGMTIFALFRTGPSNSKFTLLSTVEDIPSASIVAQSGVNRSIEVRGTSSWTALRAPQNSGKINRSNLVACAIGEQSQTTNWQTSTVAKQSGFADGDDTPIQAWPTNTFLSAALTIIGLKNPTSEEYGELTQLIVYNRQLSYAEAKVVMDYILKLETLGPGMDVDHSVMEAF